MSSRTLMILAAVVLGLAIFVYFIFKGNNSTSINNNQPNVTSAPSVQGETPTVVPTGGKASQVSIKNFSFDPSPLTIKIGTTVTWINNDSAPHTVTSDTEGSALKSQTIQPGESFQFTFKDAGTFPYYCSLHTSMKGTVEVQS